MFRPKIRMSKRMAVWTTAVVGTLGSGAGAYSVVGNPWGADEVAAVAPPAASGNLQPSGCQAGAARADPGRCGPATTGLRRRSACQSLWRQSPARHDPGHRGNARLAHPVPAGAAPGSSEPTPAPAFDQTSGQAAGGPQLPEFHPPTASSTPSAWSPNPTPDSGPSAGGPALALSPPAMEAPPADPTSGGAGSTLALGGALRQAARSAVADAESEPPSGPSVYSNAAPAPLAAAAQEAAPSPDEPTAQPRPEPDASTASIPLSPQPTAASEPPSAQPAFYESFASCLLGWRTSRSAQP